MTATDNHSNRFFIQEHLVRPPVFHGGVGNMDTETVLLRAGYQPLRLGDEYAFGVAAKWRRLKAAWKLRKEMPRGATIVFQWPLYAQLHRHLLRNLAHSRPDLRLICFLTDINGLKDGDRGLLREELDYLGHFRMFVVHNNSMAAWLEAVLPGKERAVIDFFDFLATPERRERSPEPQLCFAGALDKSGFLRNLADYGDLQFHLYGPGGELLPAMRSCAYHGIFPPARLPSLVQGSFGLLWDGESDQGLEGAFGEYAKFISPHKLSLYILSGLPVICHRDSAAAALIDRYRIGFEVSSLVEVRDRILNLTPETYRQMQANMIPLADRISTGQCLLSALSSLAG